MGARSEFFRYVRRKPLDLGLIPAEGDGGPYEGGQVTNMPRDLFLACSGPNGIDADIYLMAHTTLDINGLWDIIEMRQVAGSHARAAAANAEWRSNNG